MNRDYHTPGIICTRKYLIPLIHCRCHRYTTLSASSLPLSPSPLLPSYNHPWCRSLSRSSSPSKPPSISRFFLWYTLRYERDRARLQKRGATVFNSQIPRVHFAVLDSNRGTRALVEGVIHAKSSSSRLVASHCTRLVLTECLRGGPWLNRATNIIANFDNDEIISIRLRVTIH